MGAELLYSSQGWYMPSRWLAARNIFQERLPPWSFRRVCQRHYDVFQCCFFAPASEMGGNRGSLRLLTLGQCVPPLITTVLVEVLPPVSWCYFVDLVCLLRIIPHSVTRNHVTAENHTFTVQQLWDLWCFDLLQACMLLCTIWWVHLQPNG